MVRGRKWLLVASALLVIAIVWVCWTLALSSGPTSPLSVTFTGWTNNPVRVPPPVGRLELGRGATGRCALFWVTNTGPSDSRVWFDALQVEQKIAGEWHPFVPTDKRWSGVEGSIWMGQYGCTYAVGWPPGLAANAIWRLQVRCGKDRSSLQLWINSLLGRQIFRGGKEYVTLSSTEVVP